MPERSLQTTPPSPADLRERAKEHLAKWRELLRFSPAEAREHLDKATNLSMLAAEAEEAGVGAA